MTIPRIILFILIFSVINLAKADHYIVAVEKVEYYPLWAQRDGEFSGYARELLDEFGKYSKHSFEYRPLPIVRLYKEFLSERVDFKFPDSPYWAKDQKKGKTITYSDSALEYIDGVLVLPENKGKGKSHIKSLGTVRGFTAWDYLSDIEAGTIKIKENTNLTGLMNSVKSGRIQGVYFNTSVAKYFLEETMFDNNLVVFDPSLPHTRGDYNFATIKHPEVIEEFNKFLKEKSDLVDRLKKKYEVNL